MDKEFLEQRISQTEDYIRKVFISSLPGHRIVELIGSAKGQLEYYRQKLIEIQNKEYAPR